MGQGVKIWSADGFSVYIGCASKFASDYGPWSLGMPSPTSKHCGEAPVANRRLLQRTDEGTWASIDSMQTTATPQHSQYEWMGGAHGQSDWNFQGRTPLVCPLTSWKNFSGQASNSPDPADPLNEPVLHDTHLSRTGCWPSMQYLEPGRRRLCHRCGRVCTCFESARS